MISPSIDISWIDGTHWARLLSLGGGGGSPPPFLIVVHEGGRCLKAIHTVRGRIPPSAVGALDPMENLRVRWGAKGVLLLERGAPRKLLARAEGRIDPDWDYLRQGVEYLRGLRKERGRSIRIHPDPIRRLVPLPHALTQWVFNRAWPDGSSIVFALFEGEEPWTSLVLRKRGGDVDLMTTFGRFAGRLPAAGRWQERVGGILDVVRREVAPPHLALMAERGGFMEVLQGGGPRRLRELQGEGRVILAPAPRLLRWSLRFL